MSVKHSTSLGGVHACEAAETRLAGSLWSAKAGLLSSATARVAVNGLTSLPEAQPAGVLFNMFSVTAK